MVFMDYLSMDDREAAVIFFETDRAVTESAELLNLAVSKFQRDTMLSDQKVLLESGGYEDLVSLYEAASAELQDKSESLITKICNAIRLFFDKIAEKLDSLFQKKSEADIEKLVKEKNLQNEQLGTVRNPEKLTAAVDAEMSKGEKFLAKLASGIGVPDEEIDSWITNGKDILKKVVPVTLTVGGGIALLGYFKSKIYKYKNEIQPKEEKAKQAAKRSINNIAKLDASDNGVKQRAKDAKQETSFSGKVQKILGHTKRLANEVGADSMHLFKLVGSKLGMTKAPESPEKEKNKLEETAREISNKVKKTVAPQKPAPKGSISSFANAVNDRGLVNKEDDVAASDEQASNKKKKKK